VTTFRAATALIFAVFFVAAPLENARAQTEPNPSALDGTLPNAGADAGADALYKDARIAENAENWERAVELYTRGEELFPQDARFPSSLGGLYYDRRLYSPALEHYRRAEKMLPFDTALLYRLYETAGALNLDADAARYLERVIVMDANNLEARLSLGWMYFKLHRLEDGAALMEETIRMFGDDIGALMTLATIYSDMFRYDESKKRYRAAIDGAYKQGDDIFAAIAHYNLSILESRFYQYDLAFKETESSLRDYDRATGRLARAEIFLRRLDIARGLADYEAAYQIDTSPLSTMSLADGCLTAGRLEEARQYAEACLSGGDNSWMLNFGIDPDQYRRDIHEILYKTYFGLSNTERFTMYAGVRDALMSFCRAAAYRFKGVTHLLLFKKYSLASAKAYGVAAPRSGAHIAPAQTAPAQSAPASESQHLDALSLYADAFAAYPRRAAAYISRASFEETAFIPKAAPYYAFREGSALKDSAMLAGAAAAFDPVWERDVLAETYAALLKKSAPLFGRTPAGEAAGTAAVYAEKLFALNRGALRQNGIALPVSLSISAEGGAGEAGARKARNAARKAGFRDGGANYAGADCRFALHIALGDGGADCELLDKGRGTSVLRKRFPLPSFSDADIAAFSRELGRAAFTE
jgi:tetratricopeptide (TPR) repeat protein